MGPRQFIADQLLAKADVIRAMHKRVQLCQDPQTEFASLTRKSWCQSCQPQSASARHTILQEKRAAEIYDEVGQRSLERGSSRRTAWCKPHPAQPARNWIQESARHCGNGTPGGTRSSQTAHSGEDTGRSEQPLEARLDGVIESSHLHLLRNPRCRRPSRGQAVCSEGGPGSREAWQQTIGGKTGPSVTNEHPSPASQDEDSDDLDFSSAPRKSRLSAPQLQTQLLRLSDRTRLRRLKNTLVSKGAWQQVVRIKDLCHTHVSHKWLYHLEACAGSVPDAARQHHQRAETTL